jgi:Cu+-exporting ATPase
MKLTTSILALGLMGGAALAKDVTTDLKVPDMTCGACTAAVKKALTQTKGVKNADVNLEKRTATIVYEDTQVTEAQLQKAIEKAGFKTERAK